MEPSEQMLEDHSNWGCIVSYELEEGEFDSFIQSFRKEYSERYLEEK